MGLNPITYSEIDAYGRLMHIEFRKWEISAIRRLDVAALAEAHKRSKAGSGLQNETSAKDGAGVTSLLRGFGRKRV